MEELDGLRRREFEQRSEGTGGFRRRSYDALDFLVELNGFKHGLFHDPIKPDRTGQEVQGNRIGLLDFEVLKSFLDC